MRIMNGATIDGAIVEVSLSKPIDKSALTRLIRATPSPTSLLTNAAAIMAAVSAGNPSLVGAQQPSVITLPFPGLANPLDVTASQSVTSASGNTPPNAISLAPPTQFQSFQTQSLLTTVPNVQASQNPSRLGSIFVIKKF